MLSICGTELDPRTVGPLRRTEGVDDVHQLRTRLDDDGYLYVPGFFEHEQISRVRLELVERLARAGLLDGAHPIHDAVAADPRERARPDLLEHNERLREVVFGNRLTALFEQLLGGPVRHLDEIWFRLMPPGPGSLVHCDIVFMGRGTKRLYTSWIPYGDITSDMGGLVLLERSHRNEVLQQGYGTTDVDVFCENLAEQPTDGFDHWKGEIGPDAGAIQRALGGRWLTAEYRLGDLVVFGMHMVHAGLDNRSPRIRLSSDTRYQLAAEPADERWVGPDRPGHSAAAKRPMIC